MSRHRALVLLALAPLLVACGAGPRTGPDPAGPRRDPTVLLATDDHGTLVRVEIDGPRARRRTLLRHPDATNLVATQLVHDGTKVVVAEYIGGAMEAMYVDASLVDLPSGERRRLTRGGASVKVLLSPDGRHRYVLEGSDAGVAFALYRTDSAGRGRTDLVPESPSTALLDAALTSDGRTLYVVSSPEEKPAELLAVDTATGARRVIPHGTPYDAIYEVAVSPDGRMLALTVGEPDTDEGARVVLLPVDRIAPRFLAYSGMHGVSAFSGDGSRLVLGLKTRVRHGEDDYDDTWQLALADVATGRVDPIPGTEGLRAALPLD